MSNREAAEAVRSINDESVVAGRQLTGSIRDWVARCQRLILDEQAKPAPDTALIDVLCDGVRLAREHSDVVTALLTEESEAIS